MGLIVVEFYALYMPVYQTYNTLKWYSIQLLEILQLLSVFLNDFFTICATEVWVNCRFFVIPTVFDKNFQMLSVVSVGHTRKHSFVIW